MKLILRTFLFLFCIAIIAYGTVECTIGAVDYFYPDDIAVEDARVR